MKDKNIHDLEKKYDLGLDKIILKIKKEKAKLVLLQFPDGLKLYATAIIDYLKENTNAAPLGVHQKTEYGCKFLIWLGDCFGACDVPILGKELESKIDLVVQFGHSSLQPAY